MADHTAPAPAASGVTPRGRFAPSPTGPLHFGSLVSALASYLDARSRGAQWLVRIEDLDQPRARPGAAAGILRTLQAFGLDWDQSVRYQSKEQERYAAALARMIRAGHAYACGCSRSEIARTARRGIEGLIYPGTCRQGVAAGRAPRAFRLRVTAGEIAFQDAVFGALRQDVAAEIGDFVLKRADGIFAYQLAVVLDDADQSISEVVRGADLLDSTARQMLLQRLLGLPAPAYLHVPVAVNAAGAKLSKTTLARPLDPLRAGATLLAALRFLGQCPPPELAGASATEILCWGIAHWDRGAIPRRRAIAVQSDVG
ncbi:MAG: tRNA glutamyl-Q(34) synthetase GluQRS [Burkholderiales bacterium]|nr:tRNA glutamyl-Q(34) synthetase GluQRS [Burkholderiales bacterium]